MDLRDSDAPPTAVVTGATSGLGLGVARALARRGMGVVAHGRDTEKCRAVAATIRRETGNSHVHPLTADFSQLSELDALARTVVAAFPRIDLLVNNAGIGTYLPGAGRRVESADGYELRFAVNYLAPFWLTERIRAPMLASGAVRLVNVVSGALSQLDFDDLMARVRYDGATAYGRSKLALVMHAFDQADSPGHRAVCVNPGWYIPTGMDRPGRPVRDDLETGVAMILLAVESALSVAPVEPFLSRGPLVEVPAQAHDREQRRRLRAASLRLVENALCSVGSRYRPSAGTPVQTPSTIRGRTSCE